MIKQTDVDTDRETARKTLRKLYTQMSEKTVAHIHRET
jgi:hypothetical protein